MTEQTIRPVAQTHVTSGGVVTHNKGAVVQDTAKHFEVKRTILKVDQVLWYILGFVEILLAFRLVLRLLAANPQSGFTRLVYDVSTPFVSPFFGIFGSPRIGGSVIEWSTLMAMIVYYVLVFGIIKLLHIAKPVTPEEVETKVDYS